MKKIICVLLMVVLSTGIVNVCQAEDIIYTGNRKSGIVLLSETPVINQKDVDNNFQNYAEPDATTYMRRSGAYLANIVGMVLDSDTEKPISGASIAIDGEDMVVTGEDGRFQIQGLPSETYDWMITANGYCTAEYRNYDVDSADGTTIFTFYISKKSIITKDRKKILEHQTEQMATAALFDNESNIDVGGSRSMSTVPKVRNTIIVKYNGSNKPVKREPYIYTVLSAELYTTSYYTGKGLTSAQVKQLYCAQAIAANTFLEYCLSIYSNHNDCDVCDSDCCQVYDPTKVTQAAINATADIFYTINGSPASVVVFYEPKSGSYNYIYGAFFSSCNNNGTKTHSTDPALKAVSCTDIDTGAGGHRYGMCQMGAATLAKNGKNASQIVLYYYSNCDTEFCILK